MKVCTNKDCEFAGKLQSLDNFSKKSQTKDGLEYYCKLCVKKQVKLRREKNKEKIHIRERKYREENRERIRLLDRQRNERQEVKIAKKEKNKQYYEKNKEEIRVSQREYERKRLEEDFEFRIKKNLRRRLLQALTRNQKAGSAIIDLGITIDKFKKILEGKWYKNPKTNEMMTWENYGKFGWHIDHIIPLSAFDLTDPEQFKKAVHYTNLQPMWWFENISKRDKILVDGVKVI